jgi:ATP-dependent DNA helicase RecG
VTAARQSDQVQPRPIAEQRVLDYLGRHPEIKNAQARDLTGLPNEDRMKGVFRRLREQGLIERIAGRRGNTAAWRLVRPCP